MGQPEAIDWSGAMQIGPNESKRHRDAVEHCKTPKSEVWDILGDAGLPQGQGIEWLFDHLERQVEERT